ncbi:MAG TPA: DNA mismatch repair protein MutS [Edaphocola sp.]|nr:DNA mismatch repair protein MutS [Edaphocola sp.]
MAKNTAETPLMKQHREIKNRYPDAILLFRVGDFYETFGQDALITSKVLGITLTKRSNGAAADSELAGFPHHALDTYLHKLVKAGYRVAICDQLEDPRQAKGIVKRGVTELVTPGVALDDKLLENKTNNFLASVFIGEKENGICFLDVSTGECLVAQGDLEYMDKLLQSFQPSEVILAKSRQRFFKENLNHQYYIFSLEDWIFEHHYAYENLIRHFDVQSLKGFGIEEWPAATIAAGAALHYLKDTEHPNLQHLTTIERVTAADFLWMDRFTIRNLELIRLNNEQNSSLLDAIDETQTPMGARLLKRWLIFPLTNLEKIEERQELVYLFLLNQDLHAETGRILKQIGDIERLTAKIPLKRISPRELVHLGKSLQGAFLLKKLLKHTAVASEKNKPLENLSDDIQPNDEVQNLIARYLNDEAPVALNKGNVIREGLNDELDELRNIAFKSKEYLARIQQEQSEITGISSLKISFNNVFGYYLEVTNTHKDKVPESWIRKQTLANAERYIIPELKEYEEKILNAQDRIAALEQQLYSELLDRVQLHLAYLQACAQTVARIDVLYSFARTAARHHYCRPQVVTGNELNISEGRHPVIEQNLPPGEAYVANDIFLDKEQQQIIILTGPNMSGKSALLRQTALITLMAHMGSFVPATAAKIGLTDKIFTRVGASDNLSGGESTFMVEMNETASIINNISSRSLILLDEIGRGTSTYDGISIAWSIVEYIHNHSCCPKTLFATHYHELNELENKFSRIRNYHITHRETGHKVIFLRKLEPGGSRHSFGIQVAKMAGMPPKLTDRANEILAELEDKNKDNELQQKVRNIPSQTYQLNIFEGLADDLSQIKEKLFAVDITRLTPVEALLKLNELKEIVKNYNT